MSMKIHEIIIEDLIDKITKGFYKADEQLPTNKILAKTYSTSEVTVRKSIAELSNRGYLYSKERIGTFVKDRKNRDEHYTITISKEVNLNEPIDSSNTESVRLALSSTTGKSGYLPSVETRILHYSDMIPICYEINSVFFRGNYSEKTMLRTVQERQESIWNLLNSFNVKKRCEITMPEPELSIQKQLLITPETPVLCFTTTYFTLDDAPIAKSICYVAGANVHLKGYSVNE